MPYLGIKSNGLGTNEPKIFPLTGISNSVTTFDNEQGFYPIIKTDEFGFHNNKKYNIQNKTNIILLGDSFTEGYSVNSNENIEHFLSKNFQQVINMGKSGNGTLFRVCYIN